MFGSNETYGSIARASKVRVCIVGSLTGIPIRKASLIFFKSKEVLFLWLNKTAYKRHRFQCLIRIWQTVPALWCDAGDTQVLAHSAADCSALFDVLGNSGCLVLFDFLLGLQSATVCVSRLAGRLDFYRHPRVLCLYMLYKLKTNAGINAWISLGAVGLQDRGLTGTGAPSCHHSDCVSHFSCLIRHRNAVTAH